MISENWNDFAVQLIMPDLVMALEYEGIRARLSEDGTRVVAILQDGITREHMGGYLELRVDGRLREGVLNSRSRSVDSGLLRRVDSVMRTYGIVAYQSGFVKYPFDDHSLWR